MRPFEQRVGFVLEGKNGLACGWYSAFFLALTLIWTTQQLGVSLLFCPRSVWPVLSLAALSVVALTSSVSATCLLPWLDNWVLLLFFFPVVVWCGRQLPVEYCLGDVNCSNGVHRCYCYKALMGVQRHYLAACSNLGFVK